MDNEQETKDARPMTATERRLIESVLKTSGFTIDIQKFRTELWLERAAPDFLERARRAHSELARAQGEWSKVVHEFCGNSDGDSGELHRILQAKKAKEPPP